MQVLTVSVCDDDADFLRKIEQMLIESAFQLNVRFDLQLFSDERCFVQKLDDGYQPDVVFLDVEMPEIDGLSLGHFLRKQCGSRVVLIYMSYLRDYALHAFQVQPLDFLMKPVSALAITQVLEKCMTIYHAKEAFHYTHQGIAYDMSLADIVYFESFLRQVKIHGKMYTHTIRSTIGKIEASLQDGLFVRPHQSYLVNEIYVKRRMYDALILENDVVIPISQNRRRHIRAHFLKHLDQEVRGEEK